MTTLGLRGKRYSWPMSNGHLLGGLRIVTSITDLNAVDYSCASTINGATVSNSPMNGWGSFICIKGSSYISQLFLAGSNNALYYRTTNTGPWVRSYDETILTDSAILSPLASALGADGVRNTSPTTVNADTLTTPGSYTLSGTSSNIPEQALCILVVKSLNTNSEQAANEVSQTAYYRASGQIYHRAKHENSWSAWARVDNFGCKTAADLASLLGGLQYAGEVNSSNIANVKSGVNRAYFYPWNSQGTGVSGGPGISAKSTNTAGFLLMGNVNGELYFGVAQNESGYKWFKLTGATPL